VSGRNLGATLAAVVAGASGFAGLLLVGYLLYQRLWGGESSMTLLAVEAVFGAAGLYAGWILGMLVFSAIRDAGNGGRAA
jgi:hypothetical protein